MGVVRNRAVHSSLCSSVMKGNGLSYCGPPSTPPMSRASRPLWPHPIQNILVDQSQRAFPVCTVSCFLPDANCDTPPLPHLASTPPPLPPDISESTCPICLAYSCPESRLPCKPLGGPSRERARVTFFPSWSFLVHTMSLLERVVFLNTRI